MSIHTATDTIAAIATPLGNGGIGVVRLSGPQAGDIFNQVFTGESAPLAHPRRLILGQVRDGSGAVLDSCLGVWMPGPHSYTGEDVAELQCHGGVRLLRLVLQSLLDAGARLANPGEFTLRAFLNGRLDLSQAEAVLDLIQAKTPTTVQLATAQLQGALGKPLAQLEAALTQLRAALTVAVDFPEDADAPSPQQILDSLDQMGTELDRLLRNADQGQLYREGVRAVLVGAANAGKSSLLNALLATDRAIVTDQAGTTRDIINETLDLDGLPLVLTDTAGLRAPDGLDPAEQQGMLRSREAMAAAQILLLVVDSLDPSPDWPDLLAETAGHHRLILLNKTDITPADQLAALLARCRHLAPDGTLIPISAKTGAGLDQLRQAILEQCTGSVDQEQASPLVINARHHQELLAARACLLAARATLESGLPVDLTGVDLEEAAFHLGQVSGSQAGEALLDTIFSQFCLGK